MGARGRGQQTLGRHPNNGAFAVRFPQGGFEGRASGIPEDGDSGRQGSEEGVKGASTVRVDLVDIANSYFGRMRDGAFLRNLQKDSAGQKRAGGG